LTYEDSKNSRLGEWSTKEYDDLDGVDELTHLPDDAFHRNVDMIVLEAGTKNGNRVKTALVCPPTIYGAFSEPVYCIHRPSRKRETNSAGIPMQVPAGAQLRSAPAKSTNSPN
jgi:hypothetical protein